MISRFKFGEFRFDQGLTDSTEGFWPSLVDMVALLMIVFMTVFALIMVKHWDTLVKLKKTMEIERAGMLMAGSTPVALEGMVRDPENDQALLAMRIWEMQTERDALEAAHDKDKIEIERLKALNEDIQKKAQTTAFSLARLDKDLLEGQALLIDERRQRNELAIEYDKLQQRLTESEAQAQGGRQELRKAKEQIDAMAHRIERSLKPPRSAIDKHVVEVTYLKTLGGVDLAIKTPGSGEAERVQQAELQTKLDMLKKRYPDALFIRVNFPPGSLASPKESWEFARELLGKYDYYYATP